LGGGKTVAHERTFVRGGGTIEVGGQQKIANELGKREIIEVCNPTLGKKEKQGGEGTYVSRKQGKKGH